MPQKVLYMAYNYKVVWSIIGVLRQEEVDYISKHNFGLGVLS